MRTEEIIHEVKRLAPWYYLFDLQGVRTDITAPFDKFGHRTVKVPSLWPDFWKGKTVLNMGCNEGGYSFSALEHGARSVDGFDVRAVNVEKARLVAKVKGYGNVRFEQASGDKWFRDNADRRYDLVLMCGLLYHLSPSRGKSSGSTVAWHGKASSSLVC